MPYSSLRVSRAVLLEHEDGMQPRLLAAEGFVKGGRHILTAQLLAKKIAEWGHRCGT